MVRVMAQGTFDVLHPGHLHYLEESAALGDDLAVVIGRDERLQDKKDLLFNHQTRRDMVEALDVVDEAYVGVKGDIYDILETVQPDIVTLGYDQPYDEKQLRKGYKKRGYDHIKLERISEYEASEDEIVSSSVIKEQIKEASGEDVFFNTLE